MILGLHLPVARGFAAALELARERRCEAVQVLPYRRHRDPEPGEPEAFAAGARAAGVRAILVHSRFVPCPASSDEALRLRSAAHLARELRLAAALGADAFVLHAGAYSPGADFAEGARLFAESVARAAGEAAWDRPLLLENVPGGGRRMGGSLEELAALLDALAPRVRRLGACLDTAHAHAAGYDLSTGEGALRLVARAHRLLGRAGVAAFHLNDTRALLGSRLEDHRHWGEGRLGTEGLAALLSRPEFAGAPGVLEPPRDGDDAASLELVRAVRASA